MVDHQLKCPVSGKRKYASEHEALATSEGMPSGQLDEDPLPPVVKSTAAGE